MYLHVHVAQCLVFAVMLDYMRNDFIVVKQRDGHRYLGS